MSLSGLLPQMREIPAYQRLLAEVREGAPGGKTEGSLALLRAARPYLIAALAEDLRCPIILAMARPEQVSSVADQLRQWLADPGCVLRFSEPESLPYERIPWSAETVRERLNAMSALVRWRDGIVIASARALMHRTLPRREFVLGVRTIQVGQRLNLARTLSLWLDLGYEMASVVQEQGTFSRRGGMVDVFPADATQPVRIELFGDQVDSLRTFDPATQRSQERIASCTIGPATEALPRFGPLAAEKLAALDDSTLHGPAGAEFRADLQALGNGQYFKGIEFYVPYLYSHPGTLLDFLPAPGLLIVDDWGELRDAAAELEAQALDLQASLMDSGELVRDFGGGTCPAPYVTWEELREAIEERDPLALGYAGQGGEGEEGGEAGEGWEGGEGGEGEVSAAEIPLRAHFAPCPRYGGQLKNVIAAWSEIERAGQGVVAVTRQARRIADLWGEQVGRPLRVETELRSPHPFPLRSKPPSPGASLGEGAGVVTLVQGTLDEGGVLLRSPHPFPLRSKPPSPGASLGEGAGVVTLVQGTLDEGWVLRALSRCKRDLHSLLPTPLSRCKRDLHSLLPLLHLFTDAEIFGWSKPRPRRVRRKAVHPEAFFSDLAPGDYVVHIDFGIGLFRGLIRAAIDGPEREYLRVDYDGGDSVYVPIHQADRLSRYMGGGDLAPALHRLGTASWERVKQQAREAAVDVARELLELYSKRQVVAGYAFAADAEWQSELEASFPYIETEDQLQAIDEVKVDMEKPLPMDRLICGDVGYGKTEVALRAAFKAVMDGKQVAVLVPTTVLAQQHVVTFKRRLAPFPVNVAMLSRFLTFKEQREVVDGMAAGTVDIVIGTHRLLSRDVAFKDLGLLIIDEEQRFGVTHKERLKQMRTEVDVLTMTATPIPRTLYMSLSGVRDMSTIDTPPEERLPVKTHVSEYDETLIRKAILRELDRGGQVFFVHNRVHGIAQIRQRLERIVPEATFAIAHGQMSERELEQVMIDFVEGKIDVLVCTTIIESGLDIPNANTIIIHRADRMGLAQMYQLRGRVGRGANRAYAYLLYDRHGRVSEDAHKRLEAILEASELGAGFTIAMRDLEIRGAGELLGTRQHGHIAAIGFDLYCRLLAQAVSELKEESPRTLTRRQMPVGERRYTLPLERSVTIMLPLDASLPADYVADETLRLQLYRRLAEMTTMDEIAAIRAELEDRFGPLPALAQNLLYQLQLKVLALDARVEAIATEFQQLVVRCEALEGLDRGALQRALGERVRVQRREIRLPLGAVSARAEQVWRAELVRTLEVLGEKMAGNQGLHGKSQIAGRERE